MLSASLNARPNTFITLSPFARAHSTRFVYIPQSPRLSIGHQFPMTNLIGTDAGFSRNEYGVERLFNNSSDCFQDYGYADPRNGYWWIIVGRFTQIGAWSGLYARTSDNGTTQGLAWQRYEQTSSIRVYHNDTGGNATLGDMGVVVDGKTSIFFGGWSKADGRLVLYKNGALALTATLNAEPNYVQNMGQFKLFSSRDVALSAGGCSLFAFGTVSPTPALARQLSVNPWALFSKQRLFAIAEYNTYPTLSDLKAVNITSNSVHATVDYVF